MLLYNLKLAMLSIRQHPILSSLMVAAIGVGIAACMTMLTVYHMSSQNPIPSKSSVLFAVQLDNQNAGPDYDPEQAPQPPQQITYTDAMNLQRMDAPLRQATMFRASFAVQPKSNDLAPFLASARMTNRDFFAMFDDQTADWTGLIRFYDDVFVPYLVGGMIPGVVAATICYYLSVPVIRAYQSRRKGRLKAKLEALKEKAAAVKPPPVKAPGD